MGLTTLDSYDILGNGWWNRIEEWRNAEVARICGARVIEWSIRCSNDVGVNVQVVKVEMFEWWVRECSCGVQGPHRYILQVMFERCSWASSISLYWRYSRVSGWKEWVKHVWEVEWHGEKIEEVLVKCTWRSDVARTETEWMNSRGLAIEFRDGRVVPL